MADGHHMGAESGDPPFASRSLDRPVAALAERLATSELRRLTADRCAYCSTEHLKDPVLSQGQARASRAWAASSLSYARLLVFDRVRAMLCLPTYDERENIAPMLHALAEVLGPDDRVLVIDDNSPDGTGEIADELASELPFLDVLHRPSKDGLGRAYVAGFKHALEQGAELVLEMDCDFSHDPHDVPRLIAAAGDADVVLGSRYVPGGGVRNWGAVRRLISRTASIYTQVLLMPVKDATGGFKCFRREVLEAVDLDAIEARGYMFQIEMTFRARQLGFRVKEIPITFSDRQVGSSKMSRSIVLEAIWKVPALRLGALRNQRG